MALTIDRFITLGDFDDGSTANRVCEVLEGADIPLLLEHRAGFMNQFRVLVPTHRLSAARGVTRYIMPADATGDSASAP